VPGSCASPGRGVTGRVLEAMFWYGRFPGLVCGTGDVVTSVQRRLVAMGCSGTDVEQAKKVQSVGLGHRVGAQPGGANLLGPVELGDGPRQRAAVLSAAREMLYRQSLAPHRSSLVLAKA